MTVRPAGLTLSFYIVVSRKKHAMEIILKVGLVAAVISFIGILLSSKKSIANPATSFPETYFIFKTIPEKLKTIITPGRAYRAVDYDGTEKIQLLLDNDYNHWIDRVDLRECPPNEIRRRSGYEHADITYQRNNP